MAADPAFVGTIASTPQQFLLADGTTKKTLFTAGANGSKVVGIQVAMSQTNARIFQIWWRRGGVDYILQSLAMTALAGFDSTTAPVSGFANILLPVDNDGQKYLPMKSGDSLVGALTVALTGVLQLDAITLAGDL